MPSDWQRLYDGVYGTTAADQAHVVPKTTDADLDAFEAEFEMQLPPSYRSFVKLFGPGILRNKKQFEVFAPNCLGNSQIDMSRVNLSLRKLVREGDKVAEGFYSDIQMIRRLVFFAGSSGDFYGWDAANESTSGGKLPVYELQRLGTEATVVAPDFQAFIEDYCLKGLKRTQRIRLSPEHDFDSLVGVYYTAQLTPAGKKALQKTGGHKPAKSSKKNR